MFLLSLETVSSAEGLDGSLPSAVWIRYPLPVSNAMQDPSTLSGWDFFLVSHPPRLNAKKRATVITGKTVCGRERK